MRVVLAVVFAAALIAEPASAATAVPEPSDLAIFLLGVAGLAIGRRSARARRAPDDDSAA